VRDVKNEVTTQYIIENKLVQNYNVSCGQYVDENPWLIQECQYVTENKLDACKSRLDFSPKFVASPTWPLSNRNFFLLEARRFD